MSIFANSEIICQFRSWSLGEIEDTDLAALDRLFNNVEWLSRSGDQPKVDQAMDRVRSSAQSYLTSTLGNHVDALKALRDADDRLDTPCALVDTWAALRGLDRAMDALEQDNDTGAIDAANRRAALEAAGDAIDAVAGLMDKSVVLAGFGEFLAEFVATAWKPLTRALGVYYRRLEWLSNVDPVTGEPLGLQPN